MKFAGGSDNRWMLLLNVSRGFRSPRLGGNLNHTHLLVKLSWIDF